MTRASLLHILDHVTGISEAEVRELEQLATAFPYCQTAHLLLAKAAHDRGSMLASQRLRRAATYAADRELLRRIIEMPAAAETVAAPVLPKELVAAEVVATETPLVLGEPAEALEETHSEVPEAAPATSSADDVAAEAEPAELRTSAPAALSAPAEPLVAAEGVEVEVTEAPQPTQEPEQPHVLAEAPEPALTDTPGTESSTAEAAVAATALVADELPPAAPLIRPPVEVGSSRFEFGLAEAADPLPAYQLPELADDSLLPAASVPPFKADEHLAYALPSGSRFGAAVTLREAGLTHDLPVAEHWHPDAIMLAHVAAHRATPAPAVSSLALIDRFLRSQPRLKTATPRPPTSQEPQADLSVRSTSPPPSLASESLAKILVRQGKTGRAIEIYEQLMQRQPEKKAYFAAQIDQLKQLPE